MKKDDEVSLVVFRKSFNRYTREWEVVAFFPGAPATPGRILCYAHVGQHCEASLDYYKGCRRCDESEYRSLKREMEGLGYRFKIVKAVTRKMLKEAWSMN